MKQKINLEKLKKTAEQYFKNGGFSCSESVVKSIVDEFELPFDDNIISVASGFSGGMGGSGCTCGSVAGGVITLGLIFGRSKPKDPKISKVKALSKELHDAFVKEHKFTCCRALTRKLEKGTKERLDQCTSFVVHMAVETAKIIIRELNLEIE